MTTDAPPTHAAVDPATGEALTAHVTANAYGLSIDATLYDDPTALARELATHAVVAGLPADSAKWRLSDIAVALHGIHGEKWREHVPRTCDDMADEPSPGSWANMLTAGRAWPDTNTRAHWKRRGLSRSHLTAVNKMAVRDPAEAAEWLERAAAEHWTANEMRRAIRGGTAPAPASDPHDMSLPDDIAATLRQELEDAGIVLLSDGWYALVTSRLLGVFDRHLRIADEESAAA